MRTSLSSLLNLSDNFIYFISHIYFLDYNNELLSQIQQLEEQHLQYQKAANEKQAALRVATSTIESSRNEIADLKRKLAVANDVTFATSEEAKQAKVENGALKRQLDALEKLALEAKNDLISSREEREALVASFEAAQRDIKSLKRTIEDREREIHDVRDALTSQTTSAMKEASEARSKLAPLLMEVEGLKAQRLSIIDELEEAKKSRLDALSKVDKALITASVAENATREAKQAEAQSLMSLREEQARTQASAASHKRALEVAAQKDSEILVLQNRISELLEQLSASKEELSTTRRELESVSSELHSAVRAKAGDVEHFETRSRELSSEIRRLAEELRSKELLHAAEAARFNEELMAARRAKDASLQRVQSDLEEARDLVGSLQNELSLKARAWAEERAGLERLLQDANGRLALSSEGANKSLGELKALLEETQVQLTDARAQRDAASSSGSSLLGSVHAVVKALRADADAVLQENALLSASVKALQSKIADTLAAQTVPMNQWFEEVKRSFSFLIEAIEAGKQERSHAQDALASLQVVLEETRSRSLMSDEVASRAQHELSHLQSRVHALEDSLASREAVMQQQQRAHQAATLDLEAELDRLRAQTDRANKQALQLQSEAARAQADAGEQASAANARAAALEEQLAIQTSTVRALSAQVDALSEDKLRSNAAAEISVGTIEALRRELKAVQGNLEQNEASHKALLTSLQAQLSASLESQRNMQAQIKQTQSLLAVVQEQRKTLQENNVALRLELDAAYKATKSAVQA
jgi:chromosome segregation ATPase